MVSFLKDSPFKVITYELCLILIFQEKGAGVESRDRGINRSAIYGARIYAAKALDAATRDTLASGNSECCFPASPARGRGQGENPLAGLGRAQASTEYS